jgi:tetratricopeptide (TPR) repeat protein
VLAVLVAGCSDTIDPTTTSSGPVTTPSSGGSTTTTLPVALSDLDKELARTAKAQNALAKTFEDIETPDDDPWFGISYALHARSQAIGCLQMLKKGDQASLDIADGVMLDVYHELNFARGLATGTAAETIAAARVIADKIGAPSDRVDEAISLLDQFVKALLPLWSDLKSVYTQVIADHPAYADAYVNLAQLVYEEGDKDGAIALIDKGIAATTGDDKVMLEKLKEALAASPPTS